MINERSPGVLAGGDLPGKEGATMASLSCSSRQKILPKIGLLALAVSLTAYVACQTGTLTASGCQIALVLMVAGGLQVISGVRAHHQGRSQGAATFVPFGIFWFSIIGYQVFPRLGFGQFPSPMAMFSFLSLWALFAAILFLASFRQAIAVQALYGSMMMSLLALAADQLRADGIFLWIGCSCGLLAAGIAFYIFLAQLCEDWFGRRVLPLGSSLKDK